MRSSRTLLLSLVVAVLVGAATQAGPLASGLVANRDRVRALRALVDSARSGSVEDMAWDAGWRSLCGMPVEARPAGTNAEALSFVAHTRTEQGDYAGALVDFRRVAAEGDESDRPLANAYVAALEMRWLDAARLYPGQPTPRQQHFWGTVFYLAAQELMFQGRAEEAAQWYRRADQSYGVHGPFLGLSLVECLAQQGRTLEAFDAYRRALVVLPPDEALAQRERFEQMRLEALRLWLEQDPANAQVAAWLDFYAGDRPVEEQETLASAPQPQVAMAHDLGNGRQLIGFDYRPEDIETGPFMWVDLYVQEGMAEDALVTRQRRAVLNQAPNGSFAWDAAPDGVRPFGWHALVYSPDLRALHPEELFPGERWQCLDAARIGTSFGLQSLVTLLGPSPGVYAQGGDAWVNRKGAFSLARAWFGSGGPNDYSSIGGEQVPETRLRVAGTWDVPPTAHSAAVWLLSHGHAQTVACFTNGFFFNLDLLSRTS